MNERTEPDASSPGPENAEDVEDLVERIAHDYLAALRAGAAPDRDAIARRHASIEEPLEGRLRLMEALHGAALARPPSDDSSRATASASLSLRCPHCRHPLDLAAPVGRAACSDCGSSFRILDDPLAPGAELAIPEVIGKFQISGILGRGSFGVVYRAIDAELGREVTLKVPRAGAFASPEDEARFLREARSAASLTHPGIVQVHEITESRGVPCIVREFIDGSTLQQRIDGGALTFRESAELVALASDAIAYAHGRGVIHRDVKPENILLDAGGRPHVTDFGLARRDEGEVTVTLEGQILGTPAYMSPEQAAGRHDLVDARSDVYSLGVVLYECLTGVRPFSGQRSMVILQVIHDEPRPPRRLNGHVPRDLETVCLKAMHKDPARRYAGADEMAADLRRWLAGEAVLARPQGAREKLWRWCRRNRLLAGTVAASAAVILGGLIGFILWQRQKAEELGGQIEVTQRALEREEGLRLTTLSSAILPADPGEALLVAIEGARASPGRLSNDALRDALAALREERTLILHTGEVHDLQFTPDGARVVSAARDHAVCVWDVETGALLLRMLEDGFLINSVALDPGGSKAVTTSWDFKARVWDIAAGELLQTLRCDSVVEHAVFSPDGARVATASADGRARVWEPSNGRLVATFQHRGPVLHVAFSGDGERLAASSHDGTAGLWSASGGAGTFLRGHSSWVLRSAFSPDGSRLVTASLDGTARIWDAKSGAPVHVLEGHEGAVADAAFSPDGARIVTASADHTARIWDAATGATLAVLRGHGDEVSAASFSPDGARVLTASEDHTARIWDVESGRELCVLAGHDGAVLAARFAPDGSRVATGSFDFTVRIWNASTDNELLAARRRTDWGRHAVFSPDMSRVIVPRGAAADVFDVATGALRVTFAGHAGQVQSASFDAKAERAVTASTDGTARVWSTQTGAAAAELRGHSGWVQSASFSPDGTRIVTAARDFTARVWDAAGGKELLKLQHQDWVNSGCFSADGKRLATMANDRTARIWDAETGAELKRLQHDPIILPRGTFSPDGRWLLTWTTENRTFLWDADAGTRRAVLEGASGQLVDAAFNPASTSMAAIFRDRTARVWSVPDGQLEAIVRAPASPFVSSRFSDDGSTLQTVSMDGSVRSWPLDPLAVARRRAPRDLTPDERDRLGIGSDAERRDFRERWERAQSRRRIDVAVRAWERQRGSAAHPEQYIKLLNAESRRMSREDVTAAIERGLALSGGEDARFHILLSVHHSRTGATREALLAVEALAPLPESAELSGGFVEKLRRQALPDLPSYASIDAALDRLDIEPLIPPADTWRFFRGRAEPSPGLEWASASFDDSAWENGPSAIGFPARQARTFLGDMEGRYTSFYARRRFTVEDPSRWSRVALLLLVDDGCIAYLNGRELLRVRVDAVRPRFAFDATAAFSPAEPVQPIEIAVPTERLLPGENVLAIQTLATGLRSKDAVLMAALFAERKPDAGRDDALLDRFRRAASGEDAVRRIRYLEARLAMRRGRSAGAAAMLEALAAADPDLRIACRLIESLRASGRADEAEARLRSLLAAHQDDAGAPTSGDPRRPSERAEIHGRGAKRIGSIEGRGLADYVHAHRWARRAAAGAPLSRSWLSALALVQHRLGLFEDALATLEQSDLAGALWLRGRAASDILCRALALAGLGRREEAARELEAAREAIAARERDRFDAPQLLLEAEQAAKPAQYR